MSEELPDGLGPVDEKIPAYVKSHMESVPDEEIQSIVDQAAQLGGSIEGRLQVAAQSGIALGVELAFRDMYDAYDAAMGGLFAAVDRLDEVMKTSTDENLIRLLASVRNPMAAVIDACTKDIPTDEKIRSVLHNYGLPDEVCRQPYGKVGEFTVETSGLMAYSINRKWPEMFRGYVMFKDGGLANVTPWSVIQALRELAPEEADKEFLKVLEEYPPGSPMCNLLIQSFVQWYVNHARQSYMIVASGGEEALKPPLISEAESRLVADDIFSRLGVGAKKT